MSRVVPADVAGQVAARAAAGSFHRWHTQAAATGFCAHPIRLVGAGQRVDPATGEITGDYSTATEPDGVLLVACGNRRAAVCPTCSATYRADTWQLVAAGLRGGKGLPPTVTAHPAVFATFTAPSFGTVHTARGKGTRRRACHPPRAGEWPWCPHGTPTVCTRSHAPDDPDVGGPLCARCYDWAGAVLFNALAPELWRRTTVYLHRALATRTGHSTAGLRRQVRVSFTKVAEYQARGLIHLHAVIRLDGNPDTDHTDHTDGAGTVPPPAWATQALLAAAVRDAAAAAAVSAPDIGDGVARLLHWGEQLDVRPIHAGSSRTNATAVAAYIAKYATKAADSLTGGLHARLRSIADLDAYPMPAHIRRLITTCWTLGNRPDLAELRLRRWAHMLGFGGHYATRSRRYSTTLTALRAARASWQQHTGAAEPVVDGDWRYVGHGYTTPADTQLAATAAAQRLHAAEAARAQRRAEQALLANVV